MTRPMRLILIVSLSLNLALAAGLGWFALQSHRSQAAQQAHEGRAIFHSESLRRAMRPGRSAFVDHVLAGRGDSMREQIDQLTQARTEVRAAILAEPFSRQRLDEAFAQLRSAESGAAKEAHTLVADLVEQAEPQEREHLARLMPERRERRNRQKTHPPDRSRAH